MKLSQSLRARVVVRILVRDLDRAFALVRTFVCDLDRDPDRALEFVLGLGRDLVRVPVRHLDLARLDRVLTLVLDRALDRNLDLDRARARVRARGRGRAFDLDRVLGLGRVRGRALDLELDRRAVGELVRVLELARGRVRELAVLYAPVGVGGGVRRVSGCARWLVRVASCVVPVGERARYAEEWRMELWELGEGRGRRRRQLAHAMRLVSRCWAVRAGVLAARRRVAGG